MDRILSHFEHLDEATGGMENGDLIVVGSRPSIGRSSLAVNIAANVAVLDGRPVGIFSLELTASEINGRILSQMTRMPIHDLSAGALDKRSIEKIEEQGEILRRSPFYIAAPDTLTPEQLDEKVTELKECNPNLALVVVDCVQRLKLEGIEPAGQTSTPLGSTIGVRLKNLAREQGIRLIVTTQMASSTGGKFPSARRPSLRDLGEWQGLQEHADAMLLVHRDLSREPPVEPRSNSQPHPVRAFVMIAKHRRAPVSTIQLVFIREFTAFATLSRDYWI